MRRRAALAFGFGLITQALAPRAFAAPESAADQAYREALAKAAGANRALLVIFHATWCGPCRLMDLFLEDKAAAAILNQRFDYLKLNVEERGANKKLELSGAADLFKRLSGGARTGIPYFAAVAPGGNILANSIDPKNGNIGFPVTGSELAYFRVFLRKTIAPTPDQENLLIARAVEAGRVKKAPPKL
ncbi:MAG TPA: thioredoxin family protein [Caulobacterales bacterium]|nr:thioredoxin family protein [Caulobacterales bacterium]